MVHQEQSTQQSSLGYRIVENEESRVAQVTMGMKGFQREDISIRPQEDMLLIQNREGVTLRTFKLPESVDPFAVEAELKDGQLVIEVPLKF